MTTNSEPVAVGRVTCKPVLSLQVGDRVGQLGGAAWCGREADETRRAPAVAAARGCWAVLTRVQPFGRTVVVAFDVPGLRASVALEASLWAVVLEDRP